MKKKKGKPKIEPGYAVAEWGHIIEFNSKEERDEYLKKAQREHSAFCGFMLVLILGGFALVAFNLVP